MSRYNKPINFTPKDILLQFLVALATITLIVWFQPRSKHRDLRFEIGKPWIYDQIIASENFPILKTEEQQAHERDSIHKLFAPYLEHLAQTESQAIALFRSDFRALDASEYSQSYRIFIEGRLRQVFARGILSAGDLKKLTDDSVYHVRIFSGTSAISRPLSQLLSQKSAYDLLLANSDSLGFNRAKLQKLNLNKYLVPNLRYDQAKSEMEWNDMLQGITHHSGMVLDGESVIDRGEVVTPQNYQKLVSYLQVIEGKRESTTDTRLLLLGQIIYVAVLCIALILYFDLFRRDYVRNPRCTALMLALVISFPMLTAFLIRHTLSSVYLIPYAILPIFVRVFMDSRTAFISHVVTILLCAMALQHPFEFIATELAGGLAAIYSLRELSKRSQIFRTMLFTILATVLVFISFDLMHGRAFVDGNDLTRVDWTLYGHIVLGGGLLLFSYPFMYFFERIFGFTSNVTLVELSDINSDLLRQLSEVAPGTFQHSMQVANLAAEVAMKIGAKSQLVRTAALYHDIGKTQNPAFFTENQVGGVNPHDQLDNRHSAQIIIRHVTDGLQLAERYRLPDVIREFIATHHGKGLVKYFYISYQNKHPEEKVDPVPFSYPGPNPSTAEQAILMMADAVEASARSLKEYNDETIGQLVDRIIDSQVQEGFFAECPITFQDIATAKGVFKEKLKIVYHTRISYPELQKKDEAPKNGDQSGSTSK